MKKSNKFKVLVTVSSNSFIQLPNTYTLLSGYVTLSVDKAFYELKAALEESIIRELSHPGNNNLMLRLTAKVGKFDL